MHFGKIIRRDTHAQMMLRVIIDMMWSKQKLLYKIRIGCSCILLWVCSVYHHTMLCYASNPNAEIVSSEQGTYPK
jgi:cytochrome c oxidase subunit IV